jgi:hypothetical protein
LTGTEEEVLMVWFLNRLTGARDILTGAPE